MVETEFDVEVERVMFVHEAQAALARQRFHLVLVNRLVFADQSEGLTLVHWMKRHGNASDTPVMLVSNFAEAQRAAVESGAEHGFGKAAIGHAETLARLGRHLPRRAPAAH